MEKNKYTSIIAMFKSQILIFRLYFTDWCHFSFRLIYDFPNTRENQSFQNIFFCINVGEIES
jgi:hypothetical protein